MTASLIPFPMAAREGRIRVVASSLRRKHGREADRYWRQQVLVMRAQLQKAQIAPEVIEHELRSFAREVFARVPEQASNPKGAA